MKDLGKEKFCLGLQIEHLSNGILAHQSTYTKKFLKHFYMDKAHPLSTPMVSWSLDVKKDHFLPQEDDEETLGSKVPYLSAFAIYLQVRYSSTSTRKFWNGIKYYNIFVG